jgi:hypothetical protein
MPSKDVDVDQSKLIPLDKYEEYISTRPSLNRLPGFKTQKELEQEEEVKQIVDSDFKHSPNDK